MTLSRFTLTGTGTSQGVPVIGCQCVVCKSKDPRDRRYRTAAFIESKSGNIAIDVGPDFRQQMLSVDARSLDAILITHEHNDHIAGLDDVRPFNFRQNSKMKVFTLPRVAKDIRSRFSYIFAEEPYPGAPRISIQEIEPYQSIRVGEIEILPLSVLHGNLEVLAFQIKDLVYITDANSIPPKTMTQIKGTKTLILNALHHRKHYSHFNLTEAIAMAQKIGASQTYLTHVSHDMGLYHEITPKLPEHIHLAYDGLSIEL